MCIECGCPVTLVKESCCTQVCVYTWCVWMSNVPHMNKSFHAYEWVMSHIWMSHVPHMNKAYEWVLVYTWTSHVTHMNQSCHTYESVMLHTWIGHGTHNNESPDSIYDQKLCMYTYKYTFHINHSTYVQKRDYISCEQSILKQGWVLFERRAYSLESSLQSISLNWSMWKRMNWSVVIQTWSWRGKPAASTRSGLREANVER